MPPSLKERLLSGITSSGSNSRVMPSPVHAGQAPWGLLKEKSRGCSSGRLIPQSGQALRREKNSSRSPPSSMRRAMRLPPEVSRAVSTLSAMRFRLSGATSTRSMTISIRCARFLSSPGASSRAWTTPSIRALTKPSRAASASILWCSPFLPRTMGARIMSRVPSGYWSSTSRIWSTDCSRMTRPQEGQWAVPTRAYSRRR
ncbi:MAG: hypothetical protein BWY88_00880 [Synergistetes bacterium ADurb.Bin520]|nr:MAG: hypothetical protein BWY88_00880 [Synergistetes bacterium ADurb.Bin520]